MALKLDNKDFGTVSEKLDEIIRIAHCGILGNERANLAEIKVVAQQAKDALYNATINNGGDAA